jgi:EpsI family protein
MDGKKTTKISCCALLIIMALAGNYYHASGGKESEVLDLGELHLSIGGMEYRSVPMDDDFLGVLGADEVLFRIYDENTNNPVWMFLGYFRNQKEGSQVHSPKHCYPGSGWSIISEVKVDAPWGGGKIAALTVSNGTESRRVYYWFQTREYVLNNVFSLKWELIKNALLRKPTGVLFVRISTPITDVGDGDRRLKHFSIRVEEEIRRLFQKQYESEQDC